MLGIAAVPSGLLARQRPSWARAWPALLAAVVLHGLLLVRGHGSDAREGHPAVAAMAVRFLLAPTHAVGALPPAADAPDAAPLAGQGEKSVAARPLAATPMRPQAPADRTHLPMREAAPVATERSTALPRASTAESSLPPAPDYVPGIRLDPGPRPLEDIEPDYPDPVFLRQGTVVLRLLISDTGHVDDVAVVRSQPPGVFEESAVEAFGKARFAPGRAAGVPVKSQITVEIQFMPINRGDRVSGRSY